MRLPIVPHPGRPTGLVLAVLAAVPGCARGGPDLAIATNWPEPECRRLEADQAGRIRWIRFAPGDDPTRAIDHGLAVDVILGGPASSYRRRFPEGSWRVARESILGWATPPDAGIRLPAEGVEPGRIALDDPRRDAMTLAWLRAHLGPSTWAEGYAGLVRLASKARRIGPIPGSAAAEVRRGTAGAAPAIEADGVGFLPLPRRPRWIEGVAATGLGRSPTAARAFVARFAPPGPAEATARPAAADSLLADLLGATLVDAQDELWAARSALDAAGRPATLVGWMTEAPPWPPAFITKLKAESRAGPLIDDLAEQLAPDPEERDWLRSSWDRPPRPIDGGFLDELAVAVGGRLATNGRFRAWLRGEWTAWARQRYRRVARRAGEPDGP